MSGAMYATAIAKLTPSLFARPEFSLTAGKLLLSRLLLNLRVPHDGYGASIRQVSIRLTDLCDLRCHTCGQWGDNGYLVGRAMPELVRDQVTPERYIALLQNLVEHGHRPGVYFWGGEPMLYRGLVDIVEAAGGARPSYDHRHQRLQARGKGQASVKAPMFLVQVSIDGPDPQSHNALPVPAPTRRRTISPPSSPDWTRSKEERAARDAKLPILAGLCTINARNADRLVDIYDAFADRLDLLVFYLSWWIDEDAASQHTVDFLRRFGTMPTRHLARIGGWRPTDFEGLSQQLSTLRRKSMTSKGPAVMIMPHLTDAKALERYYTDHSATFGHDRCRSIYRAVEINANGNMSPCRDYNDYVVGNVKTHSITELWDSEAYRRFRNSLEQKGLMPVCTRCCGLMGN